MIIAPLPGNEPQRLADLYQYDILDSRSEKDFDQLVELASYICQAPVSLITLIDKDRQWFKAKRGFEGVETSRDISFCSHAILQDKVMVVEDAFQDERFMSNHLVVEKGIRFYAGAPIVSPNGYKLGTICVIDFEPRILSKEATHALEMLSAQATRLIEIKRKNLELREHAAELASLKSLAIQKLVKENENEKHAIAYSLHEDFAQSVTTSILYMHLAKNSSNTENTYIEKAQQALDDVLNRMRQLTYKIKPAQFDLPDCSSLLQEYFIQTAATYTFDIRIADMTGSVILPKEITLLLIRLSATWLAALDKINGVDHVTIQLGKGPGVTLTITDNLPSATDQKKKLFSSSTIAEVAAGFGGRASYQCTNQSVCTIAFPNINKAGTKTARQTISLSN